MRLNSLIEESNYFHYNVPIAVILTIICFHSSEGKNRTKAMIWNIFVVYRSGSRPTIL